MKKCNLNVLVLTTIIFRMITDCNCEIVISTKKPASLSSTHLYWDASRAVDGNNTKSNPNGCQCCTASGMQMDPWLSVDFQRVYMVTRIVIHGRTDGQYDGQNLAGSTTHLNDDLVDTISSSIGWINFRDIPVTPARPASTIKITLPGHNKQLVICELVVYGGRVISHNKPSTISSSYSYPPGTLWAASRAVDGNYNTIPVDCQCCTASANDVTSPWLSVDFQREYKIFGIVVYGRTDDEFPGQDFAGSTIYLDDTLVDTISSDEWVNIWEKSFMPAKTASTVKFTLTGDGKQLVICEIFVYGDCRDGLYTEACNKECNCEGDPCPTDTGICPSGVCKPGYIGDTCSTACDDGYFGNDCTQQCHCQDTTCPKNTGVCIGDCLPGYEGPTCSKECNDGYFGSGCTQQCHCQVETCPKDTGLCTSGVCQPGYEGRTCSKACDDGYFGSGCTKQCYCQGDTCPKDTGICPSGVCRPGYDEQTCSKECDSGRFGVTCSSVCGACKNWNGCHHINGNCSDCDNGYYVTIGHFCNASCQSGSYGYNCTETCGNCRDGAMCDVTNGHCTTCADGFNNTDSNCKTPCGDGTYGNNCQNTCGNCSNSEICNKTDGQCTTCMPGYNASDITCHTSCNDGHYGQNCSEICGFCKNSAACTKATGHCTDCKDGYYVDDLLCQRGCEFDTYGYNCTETCGHCTGDCNNTNGICDDCDAGYNKTDMLCKSVCSSGYHGNNCERNCSLYCQNTTCNPTSGFCDCIDNYSGDTCEVVNLSQTSPPSSNNGVTIGVTVGVVIVVVVAVAIVGGIIFWRRRRVDKNSTRANFNDVKNTPLAGITPQKEIISANDSGDTPDDVYQNCGIMTHQLWDYITVRKQKNVSEEFEAEFKNLPDGLVHPHDDALANRQKNRYREMFPYDNSRVHLKVDYEGESEFINASHIDGYGEKKTFIASQGPMDVMVDDFWRMVWQQKSSKIIMLTNPVEGGTVKCIQYWPEEGSVQYKRIQVTMIKETNTSDYSIRLLEIKQDDETPRRVTQYYYKAWPDKDVPDSTWSLVQFWREVCREKPVGPVIVHCSAGVGRTGTYIALNNLYNQALATGRLTPFEIVETLRNQRVKMVQTNVQYVYLHEAVADALLFGTHYIWQSQFPDYYDFMIKKDRDKGQVRLRTQYDLLNKCLDENPADGRNGVAMEIDENRPKKYAGDRTKPDILHMPGLTGENVYLLTKTLTGSTLKPCIELIDDQCVKTVITLIKRNSTTKTPWSTVDNQVCGEYQINRQSEKQSGVVLERTFTLTNNSKRGTAVRFTQFEVSLDLSQAGSEAGTVQQLLETVCQKQPYVSPRERIMIQVEDSSSKGWVLCALLNEQMRISKYGGHINILESVISMRRRERSCISTYEQYKYIHDVMLHMFEKKVPDPEPAEDENNIYQNM